MLQFPTKARWFPVCFQRGVGQCGPAPPIMSACAQLVHRARGATYLSQPPCEGSMGTCSVAATYKPSMLVPRVRLPAGAYACIYIYIYIPTQAFHSRLGGASWCCAPAALPGYTPACRALPWLGTSAAVAVAQLAARRSHNPKVVSSILTCHIELHKLQNLSTTLGRPGMVYDTPREGTIKYARPLPGMQKRKPSPCLGDQLLP